MHAFVTGLGGFAGTRMAEFLIGRGERVTGLMRSTGRRLPPLDPKLFSAVTADAAGLRALPPNVDVVIHAAATLPFAGAGAEKLQHDNVTATRRLIELSLHHGVQAFVFFSSTSVFGREHRGTLSDDSQLGDREEYGLTKVECERLLAEVAKALPSVSLRLPAILGAGAGGNWVASVAARILKGEEVTFFNGDEPFNNCVHIQDVAELIANLLAKGFSGSEAAILAAAETVSIRDVIGILMKHFARKVLVREVEPQRQPFTISSAKAERIWNWRPMTTRRTLERYATDESSRAAAGSS